MKAMKQLIPLTALLLAAISLVTLRSISPDLVVRQSMYYVLGSGCFFAVTKIKYVNWLKHSKMLYLGFIVVLGLLFVVGATTRSTMRWIELPGGFKLQPSQLAVFVTSLFLMAQWNRLNLAKWRDLGKFFLLIGLPTVLIFLQPDLGTSLVFLMSVSSLLLLSSTRFKQYVTLLGLVGSIFLLTWMLILKPYQKSRISSFFASHEQAEGSAGYNARQALIAVGSGEMFGRGLGFGVQSHLKFLPERQTDFIFASLAEEWGFVGSCLVVGLNLVLIMTLLLATLQEDSVQKRGFLLTLCVNLFIQVSVNVGMNIGLLPITGLTLPLVSYGGSSILSFLISLGLAYQVIDSKTPKPSLLIG